MEQGWRLLDDPEEGFDALMAPVMVRPVAGGAEARIPGGPTRLTSTKVTTADFSLRRQKSACSCRFISTASLTAMAW